LCLQSKELGVFSAASHKGVMGVQFGKPSLCKDRYPVTKPGRGHAVGNINGALPRHQCGKLPDTSDFGMNFGGFQF